MTTLTLRQRPTVFGDDAARFWSLTWTLAFTEFRLRFYGSTLGIAWSLFRPFLFFGVIYVVFSEVADFDARIPNYPVVVLFGMVLFNYFAETTGGCMFSLQNRENLLRKIHFPRMVIPLSVAVTALLNLGMTLIPVFGFALASGVTPRWSWFAFAPLLFALILLSVGTGMLLAALYPRFRDVAPIWDVTSQVLFYLSPVLYAVSLVPSQHRDLYLLNPLASLLSQVQHSLVDPDLIEPTQEIGAMVLIPIAIVLIAFVLGVWVFNREAPKVAERL
jgi:ABC-2 type transport system permease protein